jgi:hypothetical protein
VVLSVRGLIAVALVLSLGSGCDVIWGVHAVGASPDGAAADAADATDAVCLGTAPFDACVAIPQDPLTLEGKLDTDSASCTPFTGSLAADACVLAGTTIDVTNLAVTGHHPLVLFATGDLVIGTELDAASHYPSNDGPGADPPACSSGTDPTTGNEPGPGGWGGSFAGTGGHGGMGVLSMRAGGVPADRSTPIALRGGCAGGRGGPAGGLLGGAPGAGGGAVLLLAGGTIRVDGAIDVSGAGGGGGAAASGASAPGGGGGGTGGMLVLEASSVTFNANGKLDANGGGGGQGGDDAGGAPGGESTDPTDVAQGGHITGTTGGAGGPGSSISMLDGAGASNGTGVDGGGGGGGGAAGVIVIRATTTSGITAQNVSPPPTTP